MRRTSILGFAASMLCIPASAQRPTAEEQKRTIDAAREIAIHYSGKLPDFVCTEQVERRQYRSQQQKSRPAYHRTHLCREGELQAGRHEWQPGEADSRIAGRTYHGR
jgi:hypothetical protein